MARSNPRLQFVSFDETTFLSEFESTAHSSRVRYFRQYLDHLHANLVITEDKYFDRDFLGEFSSFYASSAKPYSNFCRRIHIFGAGATEEVFWSSVSGDRSAYSLLKSSYLGFIVIRPIAHAPFGRTVLKGYDRPNPNRNTEPARPYCTHVAGLEFVVLGVAWQQQDESVSTCATTAVWSMLHSSAFDDFHHVPTTAQITKNAIDALPDGRMTFPSPGLTFPQIGESIKSYGLAPIRLNGDPELNHDCFPLFSSVRLSNDLAGFLRSGYPVLIYGLLVEPGKFPTLSSPFHTVCVVGFKEAAAVTDTDSTEFIWQDSSVEILYVHDDNLGPNVRFKIFEDEEYPGAFIKPEKPSYVDSADI